MMPEELEAVKVLARTWFRSLETLEKEIATHSNILVWEIPWTEESGRVHGVAKSWTRLNACTHTLVFSNHIRGREETLNRI